MFKAGTLIRGLAGVFGSTLRDEENAETLGKAFIVPCLGRIYILGYTGVKPLRAVPRRADKLTYWKISVGFAGPKEPDFPRCADSLEFREVKKDDGERSAEA